MERLTIKEFESVECEPYVYGGIECYGDSYGGKVIKKLADYEDAEEQGLLLKLPCKVGDTVYSVVEDGLQIFELKFSLDFYVRRMSDFGKTVFLIKEEAEQALKQMGE